MKSIAMTSLSALAVALSVGASGVAAAQTPASAVAQDPANSTTATSNPPVEGTPAGPVAAPAPESTPAPAPQAEARTAAPSPASEDIIVTARKRDETLISVPVVVTAIGGPQLAAQGITNLDGIARVTPQLIIGNQGGAVQGGNVTIRGISGPDQNPFGDQAVSFNVDSVQVAKATVRRMSDFDIGQVEVLKGPQALFFGKNSPAGIISIHTADPTKELEAKLSGGYEYNARQVRAEGYVSGPLTDTLGFRIAGIYQDMKGDLKDLTPRNSPYAPSNFRNPTYHDWALRGTLKWEPIDKFDAKLKVSYGELRGDGPAAGTAFVSCPLGVRFTGSGINQCSENDGANSNAGYGSFLHTLGGTLNHFRESGNNFQKQKQLLTGLEMNYHLSPELTLTSVTGYYYVNVDQCQNYENDPMILLPSCNVYKDKEFSQELRFSTNYDGPINFTGGVYYSNTSSSTGSITFLYGGNFPLLDALIPGFGSPTNPALINNYFLRQKGTAYSGYLQVSYKPIEQVEVDVGGRYSYEKKHLPTVRTGGGLADGVIPGTLFLDDTTEVNSTILPIRSGHWKDFSPEVTLSYRPTNKLTIFGSYKHGFLSGGFNSGSISFSVPGLDLSYKPQTIKGFEAGVKAELFDRTLRTNIAAYSYKVKDLQVSNVINTTNTISNAGAVKIYGVEWDATWKTPMPGFSIHGAVAYNHGKYTKYPNAPCYGGQTLALGCVNGSQNLAGTELIRAPRWNLSGGFDYQHAINDALKFGLSLNVNRTTSYLTDASSAPNGRQGAYTIVDANARILTIDDRYEVAVIGRNLTDKYYYVASSLVPFAANPTGGLLDRFATLSRGREVWVRLSAKLGGR